MSEDDSSNANRRTVLQLAALAGLPLAASGVASAGSGDHLGETWSGSDNLEINVSGYNQGGINVESEEGFGFKAGISSSTDTTGIGIYGWSASDSGEALYGDATASSGETKGVYGQTSSSSGYGVYGSDGGEGGYGVYSDGDLHVQGNFTASGTKDFVQTVETSDGAKDIAYTAIEADRPETVTNGVAQLEDGRAEIDLPDHFGLVTSDDEDLVVQLTPYAVDAPQLAVTERSTDRIVVEAVDEASDVEFSYTVRGTRDGYEDKEVVSDADDA